MKNINQQQFFRAEQNMKYSDIISAIGVNFTKLDPTVDLQNLPKTVAALSKTT